MGVKFTSLQVVLLPWELVHFHESWDRGAWWAFGGSCRRLKHISAPCGEQGAKWEGVTAGSRYQEGVGQ